MRHFLFISYSIKLEKVFVKLINPKLFVANIWSYTNSSISNGYIVIVKFSYSIIVIKYISLLI